MFNLRRVFSLFAYLLFRNEYHDLKDKLLILNIRIGNINHINLDNTVALLILGEDHRFYKHIGFDIIGILRALKNNFNKKKFEGASTIEQQLVRVLINDYRKSYARKIKEIFLATVVESFILKRNIPIGYLLVAHYGTNLDGIYSVLNRLNITMEEKISLENSAEIVARIKYPETLLPKPIQLNKIEIRKNHLLKNFKR